MSEFPWSNVAEVENWQLQLSDVVETQKVPFADFDSMLGRRPSSDTFTVYVFSPSGSFKLERSNSSPNKVQKKARGRGYSTDAWVGRCGPGVQTLTLFKTQFSDFPIPLKTEFKIFRPYLRH